MSSPPPSPSQSQPNPTAEQPTHDPPPPPPPNNNNNNAPPGSPSRGSPSQPPSKQPQLQQAADNVNIAALRQQLEYYFSLNNLSKDAYLLAHLTNTNPPSVPTGFILTFPKIMALTSSPSHIGLSLRGSAVVDVSNDGKWLFPRRLPTAQDIAAAKATAAAKQQLSVNTAPIPIP
eukprot:CAMPEP_0182467126 /NCGR_PEP_ID=MMETSP1319-20130603/13317_1 /TAXON_ID=172717 /ORGANISM="Bolidomonas pacifica, Strain RCC208" /LENGTH=174 /DNA_ID=CAMNT_0024667181 /DNA_START=711 /DNA_END=1232 /DNA_ORIENTATION=+